MSELIHLCDNGCADCCPIRMHTESENDVEDVCRRDEVHRGEMEIIDEVCSVVVGPETRIQIPNNIVTQQAGSDLTTVFGEAVMLLKRTPDNVGILWYLVGTWDMLWPARHVVFDVVRIRGPREGA